MSEGDNKISNLIVLAMTLLMSNSDSFVKKPRKLSTHLTEESISTYNIIVCFVGRRHG